VERAAAEIVFDGVTKRYPGRADAAVEGLTLTVAAGELCVLVGPSGGGKTTALKMVNGLVPIDEGDIRIDGRSVRTIPPTELRRGIGYVIQQVGLFPHMTVAANVATVPRLLGWPRARIRARVAELLELVGLDPAADAGRYPAALSGGQQQRVGLARALAADPPILLMDEPFAAVDPIVRAHLQAELRRLHREVGKTILFVTHDLDEALGLGDRVAIFRQGGVLAQYDTPDTLLAAPADEFVRRFVGEDRALRRLALRRLGELELAADGGDPAAPVVSTAMTARNAVSLMLDAGATEVRVVGDDGEPVGTLRLDQVRELLA
jgi:osmoprotectant transport system ATP-binding protein